MSSFQVFCDLPHIPHIQVQDSFATDPHSPSVYSLDIDPSGLDSTEDSPGRTRSTENPAELNRTAEMQLHISKIENSVAGHIYNTTRDVDSMSYSYYPALGSATLPDKHELQPYTGYNARYMSPSGSWGGDRSVTEIDSAPSDGSRSPRSVWNYNSSYMQPEYSPGSLAFPPSGQVHQQVMETADSPFPTGDEPLYSNSVTPQEVLRYPDPELDSASYGLQRNDVYRDETEEMEGISQGLDLSQDHEDYQECHSPTKRRKCTISSYGEIDSPTTQRLSRNKAKPSIPPHNPRANTRARGRPPARKANGSNSKQGHQNATRLFICSFSHYGCPSTFNSKNEWKRHVTTQHLKPGVFRCDVGLCNSAKDKKRTLDTSGNRITVQPYHHDFNRKDLFTQHQRRMHKPQALLTNPSERLNNAFEASLDEVRQRCWIENRQPPTQSRCGFCGRGFQGPQSWEERMEHVGKHFERGDRDEQEDEALREWALGQGVIQPFGDGGWVLTGRD